MTKAPPVFPISVRSSPRFRKNVIMTTLYEEKSSVTKYCKKWRCSGYHKRTCPDVHNIIAQDGTVPAVADRQQQPSDEYCIDHVTRKTFGWTLESSNVEMCHILGGTVACTDAKVYMAVERNFTAVLPNMYCLVCRKLVKIKSPEKWALHQNSKLHIDRKRNFPIIENRLALEHIDQIYELAEN